MEKATGLDIKKTVHQAFFIALIIMGAYMSIRLPLSPVPIVLADFFIMLAGLFLGLKHGLLVVLIYLMLGIIGFPVFSNGGAGLGFFLGPTGGFLIGYLLLVIIIGALNQKETFRPMNFIFAMLLGNVLLFTTGIIWLKISLDLTWHGAFVGGLLPFLPGTAIKIIAAVPIGKLFWHRFKETHY